MKVVFLNRYFSPDHSATSQFVSAVAFHLASLGVNVCVITSRQRYDAPNARLPAREKLHGVDVCRIRASTFGRGSLAGRALDYLTFYLSAFVVLTSALSRNDIVVSKTDPPLLSLIAWPAARLKRAKLVHWLQDVFPEVAGAVGMDWARGWMGRLLASLRDRSLRSAQASVVLGFHMQRYLISRNVDPGRIHVIPNWADGELIRPLEPEHNSLRRDWGLGGKFVVGYSGNMGRVHEFETALGAAEALKADDGVVFLFIGGGAQRRWLEDEASRRGLTNVRFQPYQPSEGLAKSLSAPDVHLVSQRPEVEGFVVPSKFYGISAAGRPSIFVGSTQGEIAKVINESGCGLVVRAGDVQGLVAAIIRLKNEPELCRTYGENARRVFDEKFARRIALDAWSKVLAQVAGA